MKPVTNKELSKVSYWKLFHRILVAYDHKQIHDNSLTSLRSIKYAITRLGEKTANS
jgi:hypothetical protein